MSGESDEHILARDMVDVHGAEAATVARENARAAALAGQAMQAKSWIRVLGIIQRSSGQSSAAQSPDDIAHENKKSIGMNQ